jgi:hypothetical protein
MPKRIDPTTCPAWLTPKADCTGFDEIQTHVAIVRQIYQLAREGQGSIAITARFIAEGVQPIGGKANRWCRQYVSAILSSRTVLGEYQPHVMRDDKRVPEGPVVEGYFPAIITLEEWHATRFAVESRRNQRGPRGERIRNLFTGILFDARDHRTMNVRSKGQGRRLPYLVSSGAVNGESGSTYISFPYEVFENSFLLWLQKDLVEQLVSPGRNGQEAEIAAKTAELTDLTDRIEKTKQRIDNGSDYEDMLDMLDRLSARKEAAIAELERLSREQTCRPAETLGEARSLWALMAEATPDELLDLRTRLKARINALVKKIWILVEGPRKDRWATVQLFLRSGTWSMYTVRQRTTPPGAALMGPGGPEELLPPDLDLRKWREQPTKRTFPPTGIVLTKYGRSKLASQDGPTSEEE